MLDLLETIPLAERDAWVDAVLGLPPPPPDEPLPPGAVPYLPCGVDEIASIVREAPVTASDTFVDLGSGVGRAVFIAHLLSGARAHGIEIQRSLVEIAIERARALDLDVTFECADCAEVDLDGTVFFLYAPFNGDLLRRVLARLECVTRPFVVCTVNVELDVPWLEMRSSYDAVTIYRARSSP